MLEGIVFTTVPFFVIESQKHIKFLLSQFFDGFIQIKNLDLNLKLYEVLLLLTKFNNMQFVNSFKSCIFANNFVIIKQDNLISTFKNLNYGQGQY